jgi:integrase
MRVKLTAAFVKAAVPGVKDVNYTDAQLPGLELRVRPSGVKAWTFRYRLADGRQRRIKLGLYPAVTADQVRKLALVAAADVAKGVDVASRKRVAREDAARERVSTLKIFIEDQYEPWAKTHLHTAKFQLKRIRVDFSNWLDKPMREIDVVLVERWRAGCVERGNQPVTINRNLQRLQAVLSKAVEWKVLAKHPFHGLKPLRHDKSGRVRYLEEDEENRLRAAMQAREKQLRDERDRFNRWLAIRGKVVLAKRTDEFVDHLRPIVLVALNTGLRRGELFHLKWNDVNLKTKWLTVQGRTSKSKQTRRVPLNAEAVQTLEGWRAQKRSLENPYVFPGEDDRPLTTVTTAWRSLRKQAKLPDFNFHDLRHHFASRLVQSGVDLNSVRELLGHADIKMVLRYAHLAPGGLAIAVEKVARPGQQTAAA